jgi:hypothetical protein
MASASTRGLSFPPSALRRSIGATPQEMTYLTRRMQFEGAVGRTRTVPPLPHVACLASQLEVPRGLFGRVCRRQFVSYPGRILGE